MKMTVLETSRREALVASSQPTCAFEENPAVFLYNLSSIRRFDQVGHWACWWPRPLRDL